VLCVGLAAPAALASDVTIKSSASETFEGNDNYFLIPAPKGITYVPVSAFTLDLLARTPTTRYDLHGDISYTHYLGPGAADAAAPTVKQDGVSVNIDHDINAAGDKFNVTASSRQQDVATALLSDLGVATAGGQAMTSAIGGSWSRRLSQIDTLVFSATSTKTDFTSSSAVPYVNLTTGAVWTRHLSPTADLIGSTEFDQTIQDSQARQDTKFWKAEMEAQVRPTSRLNLDGSIGVGVVTVTDDGVPVVAPAPPPPGPGFIPALATSGSSAGLLADFKVVYKLTRTTDMSLLVSRSIDPDVLGQLSARKNYQIGWAQTINSVSSLSLLAGLTEVTAAQSGTGASSYLTGNITYTRQLTREWHTLLSYNYRRSEGAGISAASSNSLMVTLTRDMTIKP